MLFFCFVFRLWRWWSSGSLVRSVGSLFPFLVLVWLGVGAVLFPLFAVFLVLRRVLFVRFPRPCSRPSAAAFLSPSLRRAGVWRWRCCPASRLSAVRSSSFVFGVAPAVVSRRSGVVLFFWVYC